MLPLPNEALRDAIIFDSHAHYDDDAFDNFRDELLAALPENGVCGVINCGCDPKSCEMSIDLAEKYDYFYAAIGFHPSNCAELSPSDLDKLIPLYKNKKVVAVGEIGLEYHYDFVPKEHQKQMFETQLRLAKELELPVVVHDREAHADTLELLQKYRPKGVVHCFSGSVELAEEILRLGMYIGLGGAVTFKNARKPLEVAAAIPADRLLLETDAPYMSPVPYRGKICTSAHIALVAEKIAEVRGCKRDELIKLCADNTRRLFSI